MDAIAEARSLLPTWVGFGPLLYWTAGAFLLGILGTSLLCRMALRPLRGAPALHWTERARLAYPARRTLWLCLMALWVPAIALPVTLTGPLSLVPGRAVACAAVIAGWLGFCCVERRIGSEIKGVRMPAGAPLRGWLCLALLMAPHVLVFVVLAAVLPVEMNRRAWLLLGAGAVAMALVLRFTGLPVLRLLRLARPASGRLQSIVDVASARTGIRVASVWQAAWPVANAIALVFSRQIVFTDGLVEAIDDESLAAIAVHELGHLSEPWPVKLSRTAGAWILLPLAAVVPILASYGLLAFFGVYAVCIVTILGLRRLAVKMELRADAIGLAHQGGEGRYARALERIYEINLVPAVMPERRRTHPHLYDRMMAAGLEPDYPRPAPPGGALLSALGTAAVFGAAWIVLAFVLPVAVASAVPEGEPRLLARAALTGGDTALAGELWQLRLETED